MKLAQPNLGAMIVEQQNAFKRLTESLLSAPSLLTEIQQQQQSLNRLVESLESQKRFIQAITKSPIIDFAQQMIEIQNQFRAQVESPVARLISQMQEDFDRARLPWHQRVLNESRLHQQMLQTFHNLDLSKLFEPIIAADDDSILEPLYVVDFPDAAEEESPIIQVAPCVGKELVRFFHEHPNELQTMDRRKFEEFVAELFNGFGFEVELTARTRDGGKDIIAVNRQTVNVKYLIECKRPNPGNPVTVGQVIHLLGVKTSDRATKAILATTTHFTRDALKKFKEHEWELEGRDFNGLQEWIRSYLRIK